jgi:hypothetical protein
MFGKIKIPAGATLLTWGGILVGALAEAFNPQIQQAVAAHPGIAGTVVAIAGSIAAHGHSPTQDPPRR